MGAETINQSIDGQLDLLGGFSESTFDASNSDSKTSLACHKEQDPMAFGIEPAADNCPGMLLIVDVETTGLDPQKETCIEVGAILFHVFSRAVLAQQSFLLPVLSNKAEPINRISAEVTRLDQPWQDGLLYLNKLIDAADVLVAHNTGFDSQWFGKEPLPEVSKRWLCTMADISWPKERQLRARPSVRDLALAYGVPVWNAHRALTDCIYISEVFHRCEDLETLILHGLEPRKLMRAQVSYDQRHLAKKAGFTWNDPIAGAWTRRLSKREVIDLDFSVLPLENTD